MVQVFLNEKSSRKIIDYLERRIPNEIINQGIELARAGAVVEVSRSGCMINGIVTSSEDRNSCACRLTLESPSELSATCSCLPEQQSSHSSCWCIHSVALLWSASELELLSKDAGFRSEGSAPLQGRSIVQEAAQVIRDLSSLSALSQSEPKSLNPSVVIELEHTSDRLGVRVLFDEEVQRPKVFDFLSKRSSRELDNLLLDLLEDYGSWDEQQQLWYVNASREIERLLGILAEYEHVRSCENGRRVVLATASVDAVLVLEWQQTKLTLWMEWVLPDRSRCTREEAIFGTGPHWAVLDNHLFQLTPRAVRISSLFPLSPSLTIPRERSGPILEFLANDCSHIELKNAHLQPKAALTIPQAHLQVSFRGLQRSTGFQDTGEIEIQAVLTFRYPAAEHDESIVYLPNHQAEKEFSSALIARGFVHEVGTQRYTASGDVALEFIINTEDANSGHWIYEGLQAIRKDFRFSELLLNISILGNEEESALPSEEGFDCHISLFQNGARVPLSSLFRAQSSLSDKWVRLDGGYFARVPGGSLTRLKSTLGIVDSNLSLSNSIRRRISTIQALSLSASTDSQIVFSLDDRIEKLRSQLDAFSQIKPTAPRKGFKGDLRSYQKEGIGWLKFLHDFDLGGILADEMGLGKTVQTLGFLQYLKNSKQEGKGAAGPALIVAPTSVVTNWLYETRKFTPGLKALILHGPQRKQLFKEIANYDIVITSYSLIRLDRTELSKVNFSYLILDEAQNIKNPLAHTTKSVKMLKARHRLALTGTPTENRPLELWSLFDFLMPGYLGSLQAFKTTFEKSIMDQGPGSDAGLLLRDKIRSFILRRTKAEVEKDLPPKIESFLFAEMSPQQRTLYSEYLMEMRPKLFEEVAQKGVRGASIPILSALLRLRQVCNHPASIKGFEEIDEWHSGKFDALKELLTEAFENNRKILLFSQFRSMLQIIQQWVDTTSVPYLYLDGMTKDRQSLIDRFNQDESVRLFLISLKAGGSGLNLTAADTVILYDPWWNPAVEAQAVDRAHRIGQNKSVNVYRLVTANSVEEKMIHLKERKSEMVDALIDGTGTTSLSLSKKELEDLLALPQWD